MSYRTARATTQHMRRPCFQITPLAFALGTLLTTPFAWSQSDSSLLSKPVSTRETSAMVAGERLSQWLLRRPSRAEDYLTGTLLFSTTEQPVQQTLKNKLLQALQADQANAELVQWLQTLPVTGRVALVSADAVWLTGNPRHDPVLAQADQVLIPTRPRNVSVLLDNGHICQAQHQPGALAMEYLRACTPDAAARDVAWIAQPNGQQLQFGMASWNIQNQTPPQPGAWLWAPRHNSSIQPATSQLLIKFLATQGMPADRGEPSYAKQAQHRVWTTAGLPAAQRLDLDAPAPRDLPVSSNDWGEIGLLQTPTARMDPAGTVRAHIGRTQPYTRVAVFLQPLDWLEGGFRYIDIADRQYDPSGTIASQSYKDKSLDVKIRMWPESRYIPQLALGVRDLGGTGLFSGEYLVASKRTGSLDWSLGLGWGYLGARGDFSNPLGRLSEKFKNRGNTDFGQGGETNFKNMFRGDMGVFGGVQWHTPWMPLTLKLELEGNNYKREPAGKGFLEQRKPINFGAVYRYAPGVDLTFGIERGNKFMAGITFRSKLSTTSTPKPFDPVPPAVATFAAAPNTEAKPNHASSAASNANAGVTTSPHADTSDTFKRTAKDIDQLTDWNVRRIEREGNTWLVDVEDNGTTFRQERVEKMLAVLHRDAPADIRRWTIRFSQYGMGIQERTWERAQWVQSQWQPMKPSTREAAQAAQPSQANTPRTAHAQAQPLFANEQKFHATLSPSFWQSFGGPDAFMLYQIGVRAEAQLRLTPSTWVSGGGNLRLIDNYDKFKYTAPSNLPRVRTYIREYVTQSRLTMERLQLTHAKQLSTNQFVSVYGGYLESMYAGVGTEWLYRPLASRWAVGVDVNHVRQRDFDQRFGLRDYQVNTGHATLYWDTGWQGVRTKLSVGQYLAGDKGATLDVSRTFNNGVVIGAWATKTNVSAEQFGEGSFDKGIYVRVPFDLFLPRSSSSSGTFMWQPLMRDGGARLNRGVQLHQLTDGRDRMAWRYQPVPAIPQGVATGSDIFNP